MKLAERARAKLNLALHVRRRRADGYHEIESIFAFTAFGDTLTAVAATTLSLETHGAFAGAAGVGDDNLVLRAARALAAAAGVRAGATLTLAKRIPVAAGLGGGSADAAAALRLLDRLWGLGWGRARLAELGATLGADVPACVWSRPLRGDGVGDELHPIALAGGPILLVNPRVALATGPVFDAWDGIDRGALAGDATEGRNDLTAPAVALAPMIGEVLGAIAHLPGAGPPAMSGSGATCFARFQMMAAARAATETLSAAYPRWWMRATLLASG